MRTVLNVVLFQMGWFASVLGAAHDHPHVGPVVVSIAVAIHLRCFGTKREGLLILASAVLGTAAESVLALAGLVEYRTDPPPIGRSHPWITAMWANFALTLRHSLSWLEPRPILACFAGAIAGPLAYLAGARLGAIELLKPAPALLFLAALWAAALMLLFRVSKLLRASEE